MSLKNNIGVISQACFAPCSPELRKAGGCKCMNNSFNPSNHLFEDGTMLYRNEQRVRNEYVRNVPKDVIEKKAIMDFLKQLPLDKLKALLSYTEINPDNPKLWEDYDMQDLLKQLRFDGEYIIRMQIKL